jgi:hypothetical protein
MQNPSFEQGRPRRGPFSLGVAMAHYLEKDGRFFRDDGSEIPVTRFQPGVHLGWYPSWMREPFEFYDGRNVVSLGPPDSEGELSPSIPGDHYGAWFQPCPTAD